MNTNLLYHGGGLAVLCKRVRDEFVDLGHFDPLFNSNTIHIVIFEKYGTPSAAQKVVFQDTRERNEASGRPTRPRPFLPRRIPLKAKHPSQRTALRSGVLLS